MGSITSIVRYLCPRIQTIGIANKPIAKFNLFPFDPTFVASPNFFPVRLSNQVTKLFSPLPEFTRSDMSKNPSTRRRFNKEEGDEGDEEEEEVVLPRNEEAVVTPTRQAAREKR